MRKIISVEESGNVIVRDEYSSSVAMLVASVMALGGTAILFPPLLPVALKIVGGVFVTAGKIMIGVSVAGIAINGVHTLVKDNKKRKNRDN